MKPEVNRSDGEAQAEEEIMMVMFVCQSGRARKGKPYILFTVIVWDIIVIIIYQLVLVVEAPP